MTGQNWLVILFKVDHLKKMITCTVFSVIFDEEKIMLFAWNYILKRSENGSIHAFLWQESNKQNEKFMLVRCLTKHIFYVSQSECCEIFSNPYGFTYVWKHQKLSCITDTLMYQVPYLIFLENFYYPATVKQTSNPYGFT